MSVHILFDLKETTLWDTKKNFCETQIGVAVGKFLFGFLIVEFYHC